MVDLLSIKREHVIKRDSQILFKYLVAKHQLSPSLAITKENVCLNTPSSHQNFIIRPPLNLQPHQKLLLTVKVFVIKKPEVLK